MVPTPLPHTLQRCEADSPRYREKEASPWTDEAPPWAECKRYDEHWVLPTGYNKEFAWAPEQADLAPSSKDIAQLFEHMCERQQQLSLAATSPSTARALLLAVASASGMATVRSEELTKLTQTLVADSLEARIGDEVAGMRASVLIEGSSLVLQLVQQTPASSPIGDAAQSSHWESSMPAIEVELRSALLDDEDGEEELDLSVGGSQSSGSKTGNRRSLKIVSAGVAAAATAALCGATFGVAGALAAAGSAVAYAASRERKGSAEAHGARSASRRTGDDAAGAALLKQSSKAFRMRLHDGMSSQERIQGARDLAASAVQGASQLAAEDCLLLSLPLGDMTSCHAEENALLAAWSIGALATVIEAASGGWSLYGRTARSVELRGRHGCTINFVEESRCSTS